MTDDVVVNGEVDDVVVNVGEVDDVVEAKDAVAVEAKDAVTVEATVETDAASAARKVNDTWAPFASLQVSPPSPSSTHETV